MEFGCLERPLARFFCSYGAFVSRHQFPFIAFPVLLTLYLSTGFFYLNPQTDAIYLYTPTDAPSKTERQIIHDLWPLGENNYVPGRGVTQSREAQVAVVAKNGANILLPEYSRSIKRLDMYIQNRIKVKFHNRTYTYRDLCLRWQEKCPGNDHIQIISELYNHGINITYPTFRMGSRSGYLGAGLGGVSLSRDESNTVILASAQAWLLVYQLKFYPTNISYVSGVWEKTFKIHMDNYPDDPFITITYFHSQTLAEELKRNADSLKPRFVAAFVILMVFAVICSLVTIKGTFYVDWVLSKPILSIFGVVNAGMGIASAMGGLILLGVQYNDIVAVMPFLVVAVGTDNMFLMVAAVKRTSRGLPLEKRIGDCMADAAVSILITALTAVGTDNMFLMVAAVKRTSRGLPLEKRIGDCMADAAVSILITALTDAFSFGVGTITTIPAVQIFCIYTCCALVLTFLYQITFFCALLSLAVKWEAEGRHSLWLKTTVCPKLNRYAPILMQPAVKVLAGIWYCIYVGFAIYGCMQLREGLEPVNLLVDDSYAKPHYVCLEKYFWHYGATLQIVVSNAPNLTDPYERGRIEEMVSTFANAPHAIGNQSIQFWMNEMIRYYHTELNTTIRNDAFYEMAARYLYTHDTEPWMGDVKWTVDKHNKPYIYAFRFLIGMRDISSTTQQQIATKSFREVAARYSEYNVTTFMPLWLFTDQYDLVVPNTVQDIVIAVLCMLFIAFLLIPQPFCALWVAFTIGSIDLGVLGYMTLWDVNLDAISMITIIMSVGFSVDYSAHITYGYVISKATDPRERVRDALGDLGWPVVQGAASTILAVAVLADVPAYMIVTFFKTVFLAISIGLLHGLVFLPLMLSLFVRGFCTIGSRKVDEPETVSIPSWIPIDASFKNRHPPPDTSPPKPPMLPPNLSIPWLESKFVDGFDTSSTLTIIDTPPLIPTRPFTSMHQSYPSTSSFSSKHFKI
ncbi:patched family protein [Dictyocaulus viviparus]|uniref:Patched family protein n=1 Tax=Dictyocaulus viviparus TaxID=29172 RepID=A0A0D8YFB0_DICVI|nr:patched family protein [Dictyocaulus viviparus]